MKVHQVLEKSQKEVRFGVQEKGIEQAHMDSGYKDQLRKNEPLLEEMEHGGR